MRFARSSSLALFPALVLVSNCQLCAGPVQFATPMLEPSPFLLWDLALTLRGGGGYKDNPSYAGTNVFREPSSFESIGAELLVTHLPTDGREFYLFFTGDDRRYFDAPDVRKEQVFTTQAQFKQTVADWTYSLAGQHFYADQVLDLSDQSSGFGVAQVSGNTLSLTPALRRTWNGNWWLEGELNLSRQYFGGDLDSYWEGTPRLTLGHDYGNKSQVKLSLSVAGRPYDNSTLLDTSGNFLPDTHQELLRRSARLTWKHVWDAERHWQTTLQGSASRLEDNGVGYADYDKFAAVAELQFESGRWLAAVKGGFARSAYAVQRTDGLSGDLRQRDEVNVDARLEFRLGKKLKLVGSYEFERSLANVSFDLYTVNSFFGGLEWEL